jgi:hypothetical protein
MHAPILFLIFNRPKHTQAAFVSIRKARPPRLYVAADGPRVTLSEDVTLCREARRVIEQVDWPCEVMTLFRDVNVGGPRGIPEALDWFFSREEYGIILEDDVVMHADFFVFCDALLQKYRTDECVMHISGNNFQLGLKHGSASYYFSKIVNCWGWATWARAWTHYESRMELADIEAIFTDVLLHFSPPEDLGCVPELFLRCAGNQVGHWDVRWWYSVMKHNGLAAVPNVNLSRNIGFGKEATHTKNRSMLGRISLTPLGDVRHPQEIVWDRYADKVGMRIRFDKKVMMTPKSLKKEITLRISEGASVENVRYVAELGKKFFREFLQP